MHEILADKKNNKEISKKRVYIYNPKHDNNPGGGYKRTQRGWSLIRDDYQQIDFSKKSDGNGFALHESQITPDTVIVDAQGKSKKYSDMSEEEQKWVKDQIKIIGSFSQKGFSNYGDISLKTFKSNMQHQLNEIANKSIPLGTNTSTEKLSKTTVQHFKDTLKKNFTRIKEKYSGAIGSKTAAKALEDYETTLLDVIDQCVKDNSLQGLGITEQKLDTFLQEQMKRLLYQDLQTNRRSVGDHGIRHLVANAINTVTILDKLKQGGIAEGTSGKYKLLGMICQVNHDIGYTLGTVATNAADGTYHKTHSGTIAAAQRDRYAKLLGEDAADLLVGKYDCYEGTDLPKHFDKDKNLIPKEQVYNEDGTPKSSSKVFMQSKTKHIQKGAIQYHDDADYDWKNNAFRSAVALSDCVSLFGKDKVQTLFFEDETAMEQVTKIHAIMCAPDETFISEENMNKSDKQKKEIADKMREKYFKGFKKLMHKRIDNLLVTPREKALLKSQVSEMCIGKFSTVKDILTRSSGVLEGFEYDKDNNTMIVNTSFSQGGKMLQDMFGSEISRQQFEKSTNGDLHISQSDITNEGQRTTYGKNGVDRVVINIADMYNPKITNAGLKKAYDKLAPRLIIQRLAILKNNAKIDGNEASKKLKQELGDLEKKDGEQKLSKGQQIFGKQGWEQLKKLLEAQDYQGLANFPLTETEKAYLFGAFKTASRMLKIAKKIVSRELKFKKIVGKIVMSYLRSFNFYGQDKTTLIYRSNGEVTYYFVVKGEQRAYKIRLDKDQKQGLEYINKMISNYKMDFNRNPEKWMKRISNNWKKLNI